MTHYSPHAHALLLNIAVAYHLELTTLLGMWIPRERAILLRPGMPPILERCVLAHELGHYAFNHRGTSRHNERWANTYAATMLVDPVKVEAARDDYGNSRPALACAAGVTEEIMDAYLQWEVLMPYWRRFTQRDPAVAGARMPGWSETELRPMLLTEPIELPWLLATV